MLLRRVVGSSAEIIATTSSPRTHDGVMLLLVGGGIIKHLDGLLVR
jgi:hypothetical protein